MSSVLPPLEEISRRRRELGLTQTRLARDAGVSQSIIAKIESGGVDPSYSIVRKLFSALDRHRMTLTGEAPRIHRAGDLMSRGLVSVGRSQLVREAVQIMRRRGYSQLPVFESGRCVGSVSEKTVLDRVSSGEDLEELLREKVGSVMEAPLPVVNEDTMIDAVYGLLHGNYGVLVSRGEDIVGILTKSDLLKVRV